MEIIDAPVKGIRDDLFAAIRYETRKGTKGTVIGLQLNGHFVFKWLVQEAWERVVASIRTASTCQFYSSEQLFNDAERWTALPRGFHIAIGRCLAYFADEHNRMLPLECVNPWDNNKLYRVIAQ